MKRSIFFLLTMLLVLLGGCHSKPVRHLASDVSLIQPGVTTLTEVHQYLGEPKGIREVSPGVKEYVYSEDTISFWGKMPVLGSMVGPSGYEMIILTIQGEVVQDVVFRNFNEKDRDWVKHYTWE